MSSPLRTTTFNRNTRPTSPTGSSPLRHTIATTNATVNYSNNNAHSREISREREREPFDYTDLEGRHYRYVIKYFYTQGYFLNHYEK